MAAGTDDRDEESSPTESTTWSPFLEPRNAVLAGILIGGTLLLSRFYRSYLKRYPEAVNIAPDYWRKRSLFGRVTSVGDADNFRMFHTPGGRLAGWEWLPWRRVPKTRKELKEQTVHIRIAGIDAPEMAHFGRLAQPFSKEAFDFLTYYIQHRRVRAYVYKRDQYDRAVATVYVRKWLLRRDVGLQMLKRGWATVYEAKTGVEFGGLEYKYRRAEKWAKSRRKGMWSANKKDRESPREYKDRMRQAEQST